MLVLIEHLGNEDLELHELALIDPGRSQRTRFALDGAAGFEQLEWADVGCAGLAARRLLVENVDTGAGAHVHQAIQLERDACLAHRGAGDGKGLRQLSFRGQALTHVVSAYRNVARQFLRDLLVQAACIGHVICQPLTSDTRYYVARPIVGHRFRPQMAASLRGRVCAAVRPVWRRAGLAGPEVSLCGSAMNLDFRAVALDEGDPDALNWPYQ